MKKRRTRILCLTALGAAFLCLCGILSIPLPPIAISLQSLGVFLVGGLLGPLSGSVALLLYLAIGALGVPVFAGFSGGFATLAGPGGGFLLSFLPATLITGFAVKSDKQLPLVLALVFSQLLIYTAGSLWYYFLFAKDSSLGATVAVTILPFLLPDAIKDAIAYLLIRRLRGKL